LNKLNNIKKIIFDYERKKKFFSVISGL
jgi:hypothetical protein